MQIERRIFIYRSIEYLVWFLIFMLIESFVNTRVGEVIDASKVELYYGIFILFTATGFLLFGATGKIDFKSKGVSVLPVIICMITVGMFCGVNTPIIVIIGAACSLLSMGYLGGRIMYRMSVSYSEIKYQGTVVGVSMAAAILLQYVIQTLIQTKLISVICFEIILAALFIFEVKHNIVPLTDDEKDKEGTKILERKNIWVYVFATILMTMILSLNDAYLVDLSANTNTVNLFSWVRLFYCLSLVLAGLIYDFKNAAYFNIFVACAMMLSTVAYAFMGNNADFNIDMSIMYFYCGFYVMFLTMHFIRISNEASEQGSALQFVIPGYGRIARCVTTALVTFVMFLLENAISVQIMILVSCVLAMILVVLLAVNDILVVKGASRYIDESLVVSELSEDIDLEEDIWSAFVQAYGFTDRECDVLEKLIHTENNLQEISEELFISKRVVQRHITSIYEKTSRSTRIGLLQLYVEFMQGEMQ